MFIDGSYIVRNAEGKEADNFVGHGTVLILYFQERQIGFRFGENDF